MGKKIIAILIGTLLLCSVAQALEIPESYNFVNDFANVIDDDIETELDNQIKEFENRTSNEIAVVTIPSLEGNSLEGFSVKLAEEWGIGKEDKDNGILLLFAVKEKRVRLEVGYGLEGVINDAKAGRILDDYVVEYRDKGDYTNAAKNGVEGIIQAIGEEPWSEEMAVSDISTELLLLLLIIGVVAVIIFFAWIGGGTSYGGFFGGSSSGSSRFGGGSFGGAGASR